MPHDINGHELKVGDIVHVPCRVTQIQSAADYSDVTLETVHPMPPGTSKSAITLNTRMMLKAPAGGAVESRASSKTAGG